MMKFIKNLLISSPNYFANSNLDSSRSTFLSSFVKCSVFFVAATVHTLRCTRKEKLKWETFLCSPVTALAGSK